MLPMHAPANSFQSLDYVYYRVLTHHLSCVPHVEWLLLAASRLTHLHFFYLLSHCWCNSHSCDYNRDHSTYNLLYNYIYQFPKITIYSRNLLHRQSAGLSWSLTLEHSDLKADSHYIFSCFFIML